LIQGGRCYRVQATTAAQGGFDVLLSAGSAPPVDGPCVVEGPLDYAGAPADVEALRALAAQHADAFGLATGVPIAETRFVDEVPGIGGGRFFYRVRAVDAAGNRSAWSPVSAPFFQVDTTAPAAPEQFHVEAGDRSAALMWRRVVDGRERSFAIYRVAPETLFDAAATPPLVVLRQSDLRPRRLASTGGTLQLPQAIELLLPGRPGGDEVQRHIAVRVIVQSVDAGPDGPNLFDAASSRVLFDATPAGDGLTKVRVTGFAALDAYSGALRVRLDEAVREEDPTVWAWTDTGLQAGARYTYRVAEIKEVRAGPQASGGAVRAISVLGNVTAGVTIEALDLSAPPLPTIALLQWVDAPTGATTTTRGADVVAELWVDAPSEPSVQILVQSRRVGDGAWQLIASGSGGPWTDVPPTPSGIVRLRLQLESSRAHELRARLRSANGKTGDFCHPTTLQALP
jgi:hypothetical protein